MSLNQVKTRYGVLQGEELCGRYEGITTFRAVPYAAPPVGKLRFMPPCRSGAMGRRP